MDPDPVASLPHKPASPVILFRPPPLVAPSPSPRTVSASGIAPPSLPAARNVWADVPVDLSRIQLSFADDVGRRLPDVLREQHGMLALLDKDNPTVARYLFEPEAWELRAEFIDVSARLRIEMHPPQEWDVLRAVARRHGISLDQYRASAVFDIGYRRCIQEAIRNSPLARGPRFAGRISAAHLMFVSGQPCGIQVLEVSLAERSRNQPL